MNDEKNTNDKKNELNKMISDLTQLHDTYKKYMNKSTKNNVNNRRENKETKNEKIKDENSTNLFGKNIKDLSTISLDDDKEMLNDQFTHPKTIRQEIFKLEMKINKLISFDNDGVYKQSFSELVQKNTEIFGGKHKRMQYAMEDMIDELLKIIDNMIPSSVRTLLNTLAQVIENKCKNITNNNINLTTSIVERNVDNIKKIIKEAKPQETQLISDVISSFCNQMKICTTHQTSNTMKR